MNGPIRLIWGVFESLFNYFDNKAKFSDNSTCIFEYIIKHKKQSIKTNQVNKKSKTKQDNFLLLFFRISRSLGKIKFCWTYT